MRAALVFDSPPELRRNWRSSHVNRVQIKHHTSNSVNEAQFRAGDRCVASIASFTSAGCNADNKEMLSNAMSPKFWARSPTTDVLQGGPRLAHAHRRQLRCTKHFPTQLVDDTQKKKNKQTVSLSQHKYASQCKGHTQVNIVQHGRAAYSLPRQAPTHTNLASLLTCLFILNSTAK